MKYHMREHSLLEFSLLFLHCKVSSNIGVPSRYVKEKVERQCRYRTQSDSGSLLASFWLLAGPFGPLYLLLVEAAQLDKYLKIHLLYIQSWKQLPAGSAVGASPSGFLEEYLENPIVI
ncbi:hypothetical protein BDV59DRAFT_175943 [Aspergillus ambiguus]|uniref:uncharacterized protein n=1 Tax=Aspergillus ambiguus TaxID=176160 RepID=UPI003CCD5E92